MKAILIDTSEDWVGVVVGDVLILKILHRNLRKEFGKVIHMRELEFGEKYSVLKRFNKICSRTGVKLYSMKTLSSNWCAKVIEWGIREGITTFCVDLEVYGEMRRKVNPLCLRKLEICTDKERFQSADILAYGDSHHKFVKNIWKDVSVERGEL